MSPQEPLVAGLRRAKLQLDQLANVPPPTLTRSRRLLAPKFTALRLLAAGIPGLMLANAMDNGGAQPAGDVPRGRFRDPGKKAEREKRLATVKSLPLKQRKKLLAKALARKKR